MQPSATAWKSALRGRVYVVTVRSLAHTVEYNPQPETEQFTHKQLKGECNEFSWQLLRSEQMRAWMASPCSGVCLAEL